MLKIIFVAIILFILINHYMEEPNINEIESSIKVTPNNTTINPQNSTNNSTTADYNKNPYINSDNRPSGLSFLSRDLEAKKARESFDSGDSRETNFDKPNPWSKIIFNSADEYPYHYHIKLRVPSLNNLTSWKNIIPNIDFNPKSGELIIPSKDEPSALAIANLMTINFMGDMTLQQILDQNLIQISINKAKTHEVVQNKLREQIYNNLYGKKMEQPEHNFEQDLAKGKPSECACDSKKSRSVDNDRVDFQSENFKDTFESFSPQQNNRDVMAYDGSDFSYL